MRSRLLLTLCTLVLAVPALAGDSPATSDHLHQAGGTLACLPGNQPTANGLVTVAAGSTVATLIDPMAECSVCEVGVDITSIHFGFTAAAECDQDVIVRLRSADTTDPNCPVPGKIECEAQKTIKFAEGYGEYDLKLICACADKNFLYFLEVEFLGADCGPGSGVALSTDPVDTCGNYFDGAPFGASIGIYARTECCNKPVGNVEESFGGVKSQFED